MSVAPAPSIRTVKTWDQGVRLFHWLLVACVALAFLSSEEENALSVWHVPAGWAAAILIAFRLVWGFVGGGGEHARFANLIRPSRIAGHVRGLFAGRAHASLGHNPLSGIAVLGLLALTAATLFTGVTDAEDIHEVIAWTLLAMIGLHVAAVVAMSFLSRDNLIGAMITGRKKATHFPGARDAARRFASPCRWPRWSWRRGPEWDIRWFRLPSLGTGDGPGLGRARPRRRRRVGRSSG